MSDGALVLLIILLAIWALLAWWAMLVAHGKGRSEFFGLLLGVGLGIFGVILCWLLPRNEDELYRRQREREARFERRR